MSDTNNGNTIETTARASKASKASKAPAPAPTAPTAPIGSVEVDEIVGRAESSDLDATRKAVFVSGVNQGADRARSRADVTRLRAVETIGKAQGSNAVNRLIRREERSLLASMGLCKAPK